MDSFHLTSEALEAGLEEIRRSPADRGMVKLIVRRPEVGQRETVAEARLDLAEGLVGDNWRARGSRHTPDRSADPDAQLTLMNARAVALMAGSRDRWPLAGDQIYVDLDLSIDNLPAGSWLKLGSAVIEISSQPHTGCQHFTARFGIAATKFANSSVGRQLRLRGLNAKIIAEGLVRVGALATRVRQSTA
jgi:hypothetical protein